MKKFLRWFLVIVVILGGLATYFFLANGKMMWHVVKTDKTELANDITRAVNKVHDYGNYNFTYSSSVEQKDKDGKVIEKRNVQSEIKIKLDGEMSYISATTTETDKDGKKTTTKYYAERTSENITTLYSDNGTSKRKEIVTWNMAIAKTMGGSDISYSMISKIVNASEYEFSRDDMDKFKKSTVAFSFSPFYVGSKLLWEYSLGNYSTNMEYNIDLGGNFRKSVIESKSTTDIYSAESKETVVVNKPGKSVEINKLSDDQKAEYSLLG